MDSKLSIIQKLMNPNSKYIYMYLRVLKTRAFTEPRTFFVCAHKANGSGSVGSGSVTHSMRA